MDDIASLLPGLMQQHLPESRFRDRVFYVVVVGVAILKIVTSEGLPVSVLDRLVEKMEAPKKRPSGELVEMDTSDSATAPLPPCQVKWVDPDAFRLNVDLVRKYQALAVQDTGNEESFVVFDPFPQWRRMQAEAAADGRNLGFPPVLTEGASGMI